MIEVAWLEGPRLRYALTTSLQSALMLRAQLAREGHRARVWFGNVLMAQGSKE